MILIFSKRSDDFVDSVIDYLPSNKIIRVDNTMLFDHVEFTRSNKRMFFNVKNNSKSIDLTEINTVWFAGGGFVLNNNKSFITKQVSVIQEVSNTIELMLSNNYKLIIGRPLKRISSNKINDLTIAEISGFKIPKYILTTDKSVLDNFMVENSFKNVISKKISSEDIVKESNGNVFDISKTILLDKSRLKLLPKNFGLSFFQELIYRFFEIRVIYFKGELFSSAIFPKDDSVDYRKDLHSANAPRIVPYKLPEDIVTKIHKLMAKLQLDTGSIDLILSKDLDYVFLEVNPVGQISFINNNCNFYLEKKIAEFLIQTNNEKKRVFC